MARLRYNGLATGASGSTVGLSLGASLTSGATSVTFNAALTHSNGTAVPTIVSPDYIPLEILDANGRLSEIVWLTAYTAAATTGTISRGNEGTTGVAHSSGDKIVGGATVLDVAFVGCAAERTTTQAIATASWTPVQFNATDLYDTDNIHDPVTNNTRLTVPAGKSGTWRFTATAEIAPNTSGTRAIGWSKNGVVMANRYGMSITPPPAAGYGAVMNTTVDLALVATDYVECAVYQDSGGALNMVGAYVTCQFLG